uniref:Uncharacterized protein n=1 Tax=Anguilla anguilla TaxID=7936 RepID=A0A0E9SU92_ANGAN
MKRLSYKLVIEQAAVFDPCFREHIRIHPSNIFLIL